MANPDCSTIISHARTLIRAESGSDVPAVADAFMVVAIADADVELLRAFRRGGGNAPSAVARETGFTLASETAINDAAGITSASTSITVDSTTGYDSAGAAVVWDGELFDIFYYTGVTATSFTGVTGLAFNHEDSDAIQPLMALPSNFKNFRRSEGYGDGVTLDSGLTYMEGPPSSGKFSRVDDGTTNYLWLPRGSTGDVGVLYDKISSTVDSVDDTVSFGDEALFYYVWRCIELSLFGRGDFPIITLAKQKGDMAKLDLLKDRNVGRRPRIRQFQSVGTTDYSLAARENAL